MCPLITDSQGCEAEWSQEYACRHTRRADYKPKALDLTNDTFKHQVITLSPGACQRIPLESLAMAADMNEILKGLAPSVAPGLLGIACLQKPTN